MRKRVCRYFHDGSAYSVYPMLHIRPKRSCHIKNIELIRRGNMTLPLLISAYHYSLTVAYIKYLKPSGEDQKFSTFVLSTKIST